MNTYADKHDYDEKWMFLGHLLRRAGIFSACYKKIIPSGLFNNYPHMNVIIGIAVDYYEQFDGMLPREVLRLELDDALAEAGMKAGDATRASLDEWYDTPPESDKWSDVFVKAQLQEHIQLHARDVLDFAIKNTEDTEEIRDALYEAQRELDSGVFQSPESKNPFDDLKGNMTMSELIPWGVDYLDRILGGGSAVGEMIGILLPSGGGKTTMGLQVLAAHVIMEEHCVYMSSEQDLGGDMTNRMLCLGLGCERAMLAGGYDTIDSELMRMLDVIKPKWKKYCHFYEWAHKPISSLDSLFEVVQDLHAKGIYPKSIIWDWWGRFKDAMVMSLAGQVTETELRRRSRDWLHTLRTRGNQLGLRSMVFHQLSGDAANKGAKHKPSSHSAQEDKNFNNMFDFCFTGTKKDSDDVITFIADKARTAANTEVSLHLNGDMCKFEYAFDPNSTSQGMIVEDDEEGGFEDTNEDFGLRPPE